MKTPVPGKDQLFRQLSEDNMEAYTLLYDLLNQETFYLCKKFAKTEEDAKDLFQEAFGRLWAKRHKFRNTKNPSGYFYIMVRYQLYQYTQNSNNRNRSAQTFSDKEPALQEEPYASLLQKESNLRIKKAISRLSPQQRTSLFLQRYEGMSYQEIADLMEISCETVKHHLKNAHSMLRRYLGDMDVQF